MVENLGSQKRGSAAEAEVALNELQLMLSSAANAEDKAGLHVRIGHVLRAEFLHGVSALKHFQEAYKLDATRLDALKVARELYQKMGRIEMIPKLLKLELQGIDDDLVRAPLYAELGDALCDVVDFENAALAYAEGQQAGGSLSESLLEVQSSQEEAEILFEELLLSAQKASDESSSTFYLKAAALAERLGKKSRDAIIEEAYRRNPLNERVAGLFESNFLLLENFDDLLAVQNELVDLATDQAELAFAFGVRWAHRHQAELAAPFLQRTLLSRPEAFPASAFLQSAGSEVPDFHERLVAVANKVGGSAAATDAATYLLATAGLVALRQLESVELATPIFSKLIELAPHHSAIIEYRSACGVEKNSSESIQEPIVMDEKSKPSAVEEELNVVANSEEALAEDSGLNLESEESPESQEPESSAQASASDVVDSEVELSQAASEESSEAFEGSVDELREQDDEKVAELRSKLETVEKRPHEYVKVLLALGDELVVLEERADYYRQAAELYSGKFGNHAEAVKAYQKLLEVEPSDSASKVYLKEMYQKRRDWDNLLKLLKDEAEQIVDSAERTEAHREIALLATEKIKKPEICVGLWEVVLENDAQDEVALKALVQLYERGRDYENLCLTLTKVVAITGDEEERVGFLTKLGQIAGDRLKNDEVAVDAYRELLALRPEDRRAQDQLKKRYVALGRWEELEQFYQQTENWDEFIRLLESNESKAETEQERIAMLQKVAELWMTQKGKPDRAARALEKILTIDESNIDAAERLIPIYEESSNAKGLAKALEVQLKQVDAPHERLLILRKLSELYESKLRDKSSALSHILEAVTLEPENLETLDAAERIAGATDSWNSLVQSYQDAVGSLTDADAEVGLRLRLGGILSEKVQDLDEALLVFRGVYEDHPENTEALEALESLYGKSERFAELLEVYQQKLELVTEPAARKATLFGIAKIQQEQLEDLDGAIASYLEVLETAPADSEALVALDSLYQATESYQDQAQIIERLVEGAETEQQLLDLKFRLAELQAAQLDDLAAALQNYREVLVVDMSHEGARDALVKLLEDANFRAEAAGILETVFEEQQAWQSLSEVLEVRVACTAAEERVELLRKLSSVFQEQLQEKEKAFDAQARAVLVDPSNSGVRVELEELAEANGALAPLSEVLAQVAATVDTSELAVDAWMRVASLQERLNDIDAAASAYRQALGVDEASLEALLALDDLFRGAERWTDLVAVYKQRIELSNEPQETEELYSQMAGVLESQLGQPAEAVLAYQEILEAQPTSQVALTSLQRLFESLERWSDLASNLEAQLVIAESDEASIQISLSLSILRETKMELVEEAIDGYREVLERNPQQEQALIALERLGNEAEYEVLVADILEPLYRQSGDAEKLIGIHEVQCRKSDDAGRMVELLEAIATLQEDALGDSTSAFDTMARALGIEPDNEVVVSALERLASVTERYTDLGKHLEAQADVIEDLVVKVPLLMIAARVFEDNVGNSAQATLTYQKVFTADGHNLEAAEALQRLYQASERFDEMSLILQKKSAILNDTDLQKAALAQAAAIEQDQLNQPSKAIAVYEQILELDPEDLQSVDALIGLFAEREDWKSLLGVYAKKVELLFDPEEKKAVLYEIGDVFQQKLQDEALAIDTYQRVLELDPDDLTALARLDALYQASENWQELLSILSRQAELTGEPNESAQFQFRVAALYEIHLDDLERAVELYQQLISVLPEHEETLKALERIQAGSSAATAAALVLEQVYEASGNAARLASSLEVQAKHAEDPYAKVEFLERIAGLQEESLEDIQAAFETMARAVSTDSANSHLLEEFERLALAAEGWKAAASVYDAQLTLQEDEPERVIDLGLRVARIYETQLDDVESAIERYVLVTEADPEQAEGLGALDRLYEQSENWQALVDILQRESEIGQTPDDILEFKNRLGQVYQDRLGNINAAITAYQEVLAAAPENENSLAALESLFESGVEQLEIAPVLEPLYQASAEWDKLIALHEGVLKHLKDPEERKSLYRRMAEETEEHILDSERAFQLYARALLEQPSEEDLVDDLERLAGITEQGWTQLAKVLAEALGSSLVTSEQVSFLGARLAKIYEVELSAAHKAEQTFRYVLAKVHTDSLALENLDRLYTASENWNDLAPILETRGESSDDEFDKVEFYLRLGHLFEEKLALEQVATTETTVSDVLEPENQQELEDQSGEPSLDELIPAESLQAGDSGSDDEGLELSHAEASVDESAQVPVEVLAAPAYNLSRLQDAIRAYRIIFDQLQPDNDDAIESLERVYEVVQEWQNLDSVYERQLTHVAGEADEADIRAKRASLAALHLNNASGAIDGWKRVLELRGEDPEALRALGHLYEAAEQWSELTEVLERHFDIAESDEDRVHVLVSRARLFDEQLNRDDEALETYQRVLDIDYSNAIALTAVSSIWRRRKNQDELVSSLHALVDQGVDTIEPPVLAESYRELAQIYETIEQSFEAIDAWVKLLEFAPGDSAALDRLEALYGVESQWPEIIDVKMQRAQAFSDAAEQIREYLEVTELWKAQVLDYSRAVPAYEAILLVEPLHERAFKELEKLHTTAESWEPLIELYLNRLEQVSELADRSALLRRIAAVFNEQLDDHDQAFDALVTAFADDYFDDETALALEKAAQASGRWPELIASANQWLKDEEQKKPKIQLSLRLGKWYGENLGHSDYAQRYYEQVLELDPRNTRVMRQMAAISRISGDYQRAGAQLQEALKAAVADEQRVAINTDLGDLLFRHMDQPEQAITYYRRSLQADAQYLPALNALEHIYESRSQMQELAEVLAKKADAIQDPIESGRQQLRLGELLEKNLVDVAAAANAYRSALEIDAESLAALRGLERTLQAQSQWQEVIDSLEKQLVLVDTQKDRIDVLLKLAQIQEEQFLKADVAAERLEQALEIDGTNEEAYASLARCYRRLKRWNDLIDTLRRHLEETPSRETKLELFVAIGATFRDEIGDLDEAIDAYQSVVDADETNVASLDALSKLFEQQGDAARAIEMMTRVAELTTDGAQQVDMYYRIGRSLEEKLADRFAAREKFELALDLDPSHLPSLAALRTIAVDEADWESAARYLEQEQEQTESPRQRAKVLVELGKIRDEMLGEKEQAIIAFEEAISLDPDCDEAALPLVREYSSQKKWEQASPLAELLVRKSKSRERQEQHELQKILGTVKFELGQFASSLKAYQEASQLDLTSHEAIRGVADAAFSLQDWPTALSNYQRVLSALGEEELDERAQVYYRLGCVKREQGQDKQAINNFEKALGLDVEHRESLEALVAIYEKSSDWSRVAEYKRQILDSVFDGKERYSLLVAIGDLWMSKLKDYLKALEAYEEARDLEPQDHVLLHKMVQAYQGAGEWQKMVDVLDAIMEIDSRPKLHAKLLNTQAQIYRDMLEDSERAVELFNSALDADPNFLEAFERINKILTKEKNWKQQERSYRKMLLRIKGQNKPDLEHKLWSQLGIIYRDRMGRMNEAIEAFRMSASHKAEAPNERKILAELYEATERWDDAIKEQRRLLEIDPLASEPYQALYKLYLHKQTYDQAWCIASALSFMKKADAQTEQFYQDYRPQGVPQVSGRLGAEHWARALNHPDEDMHLSRIFEMIEPAARKALAAQNKLKSVDEQFRTDPNSSTITFASTLKFASDVLGVQLPALFVRKDVAEYIVNLPAAVPTLVAGQLVLSGFNQQELLFISAKHLTPYRPEHLLRVLFPSQSELKVMLFAAIHLADPSIPLPADLSQQAQTAAQLLVPMMEPVHLDGLRRAVKEFIAAGAKANVKQWGQTVELTACRAGLLLCGDLAIARKIIPQERQLPGDLPPAEKLKELIIFSASEQYFALRQSLGIQIQTG